MMTCIGSFIILKGSEFKEAFFWGVHICISRAQRASRLTGSQPPQLRRLRKAGCYKAPGLAA